MAKKTTKKTQEKKASAKANKARKEAIVGRGREMEATRDDAGAADPPESDATLNNTPEEEHEEGAVASESDSEAQGEGGALSADMGEPNEDTPAEGEEVAATRD